MTSWQRLLPQLGSARGASGRLHGSRSRLAVQPSSLLEIRLPKACAAIVFYGTFLLMMACPFCRPAHANGEIGVIPVRVLSIKGCEATPPTIERVTSVAAELNIKMRLIPVVIESSEQAVKERFLGSPTVQINELDIEPEARGIQNFGVT